MLDSSGEPPTSLPPTTDHGNLLPGQAWFPSPKACTIYILRVGHSEPRTILSFPSSILKTSILETPIPLLGRYLPLLLREEGCLSDPVNQETTQKAFPTSVSFSAFLRLWFYTLWPLLRFHLGSMEASL